MEIIQSFGAVYISQRLCFDSRHRVSDRHDSHLLKSCDVMAYRRVKIELSNDRLMES